MLCRNAAMHDPEAVRLLERVQHLENYGDGVAHRKRAFATKLGKSRPFNIIGRHDHLALELEGVMKRDDVRMGQAGVDPHLPREALAGLAIPGGGAVQRAERFNLTGRQVPDFVSNAGARLIDDIEALVFADYLVNSEGHGWSRCYPV